MNTPELRTLSYLLNPIGEPTGYLASEAFLILTDPDTMDGDKVEQIKNCLDQIRHESVHESVPHRLNPEELGRVLFVMWQYEGISACMSLLEYCDLLIIDMLRGSKSPPASDKIAAWATGCILGVLEIMLACSAHPPEPDEEFEVIQFAMRVLKRVDCIVFKQDRLDQLGKGFVDFLTGRSGFFGGVGRAKILQVWMEKMSELVREFAGSYRSDSPVCIFAGDVVHKTIRHYIGLDGGMRMIKQLLA
jgi:hypothetical protein